MGDTGASNWTVMYHYNFSKRTMFQAFITRISNQARAIYDFDVTPVVSATSARIPGADPLVYAIGIRHHF
jgi:predicted porin